MKKLLMWGVVVLVVGYFLSEIFILDKLSLEEGRAYYQENKELIQHYGKDFFSQDDIVAVTRLKSFGTVSYSIESTFESSNKETYVSLDIPKWSNEAKFWEQDPEKIIFDGGMTLATFLDENNIDKEELLKWIRLLYQNEYYAFAKSLNDPIVDLYITPYTGLTYKPSGELSDDAKVGRDVVKIDDNWYFFEVTEWM